MALVVVKYPGRAAEVQDLEKDVLGFLQGVVGGSIELIRLSNDWDMYCNKEGKLINLEPHLLMPLDIIHGPVVVTGFEGADTVGLKAEDVELIRTSLDGLAGSYDMALEICRRAKRRG